MPSLYKAFAGGLVRQQLAQAAFLSVDGLDDQLKGGRLMATTVKLDRSFDVDYKKSLAQTIYTYAYGEGPGRFQLGGLVFLVNCVDGSPLQTLKELEAYVDANNVYDRQEPITVVLGGLAFSCYLEAYSFSLEDNAFNFGSFSLSFTRLPKPRQ